MALQDWGFWQFTPRMALGDKLEALHKQVLSVAKAFNVQVLVLEKIFLGPNVHSAFVLGHVRGVCLAAARTAGLSVKEYTATEVKKLVTSSGKASKQQVAQALGHLLACELGAAQSMDATDAIALAYCHARKSGFFSPRTGAEVVA